MKRKFTILTAALALLAFLAIPMGMWGQTTYEQLTSIANIDESAQYVLGIDGTGFHYEGTSSWGKTALPSAQTPIYYTLTKATDGNSFTAHATISGTTYYLQIPTSNTFSMATSTGTNTDIIIGTTQVSGTNYAVANKTTTARHLRINGTSGLRSYAGTTGTMAFFYKVVTSSSNTYTVTFDAGDGTFVGNNDFPNTTNTKEAGTYTLPSATRDGYTFNGWVTGNNEPITGSYEVSNDVDFTAAYTQNGGGTGDNHTLTFDFEDETAHRTSGSNSYTGTNEYEENGADIILTYADAVGSGSPLSGSYHVLGRIAKNTTNSPVVLIGPIDITNWNITKIEYLTKGVAAMSQVFETSLDGSQWTSQLSIANMPTSATTETVNNLSITGTELYLRWTVSVSSSTGSNRDFNLDEIVITYIENGNPNPSITAADVNIAYDAEEGTINYTINNPVEGGSLVASCDTEWIEVDDTPQTDAEGSIDFLCAPNSNFYAHSATVTLTYTYGNSKATATKEVTVTQALDPNANGSTAEFPINVSEAIEAIDEAGTVSNIYVGGIVSEIVTAYDSYYENITFDMIDEEGNEYYLRAYRCGGNEAADVTVGDEVIVYGNLTKYGSIYEFGQGCELVSLTHPVVPTVTVADATVSVPAEGGEGTLTVTYENFTEIIADVYFCNAEGEAATYEWITAEINEDNNVEYLVESNEGEARTAYFKVYALDDNAEEVYSNLITINQDAYVALPTPGSKYVQVTSTADLTSGQYLIVYEDGEVAFNGGLETLDAAGNTIDVTIQDDEIAVTTETAAAEFTIDMAAGTIMSASGYYIGRTGDSNGMNASQEEAYENTISIDDEGNAVVVASGGAYLRYNATSGQDRFRYFKSSTYTGQKAIQLYKKVYNLDITGYGTSAGGYYLIASPVTVNPENVEGMTEGHFDLFRFNESADYEWENWKVDGDHYHFNLVPGQGYLYAHKTDVTLTFTGTPYNGEPIILSKTDGNGIDWPGWNLVGNPYGVMAYLDRDFYTMNDAGDEIVAATNNSVQVMEGVFVIANFDGEELTFSTEAPAGSGEKIVVNVSNTNGTLLDRAMIRFGEGGQLPKFQINENSTKLYINEGEEEFAVVRCINESSTLVSFRPAENGTYTLSINTENVEMEYLHLIDNLTGADIDLLATPSYTFESNTTDNADRFAVVYTATTSVNENNTQPFAFFNGSEWVIMNEGNATMQVVDVTGRVISTETLNGNATINLIQVPGVYMIRLVNGNDVKVQKVVVK